MFDDVITPARSFPGPDTASIVSPMTMPGNGGGR